MAAPSSANAAHRASSIEIESPEKSSRLSFLWKTEEKDVRLPPEVEESFQRWKVEPATLLSSTGLEAPTSPWEHYEFAQYVRMNPSASKIVWRFVATAYFDVVSALSPSNIFEITKDGISHVVAAIRGESECSSKRIANDIRGWAREGKSFRSLANRLGGTSCFFLLPDFSNWIWSRHVYLRDYDRVAAMLLSHGIIEKAQHHGALAIASAVEEILKRPFQSTISNYSRLRSRQKAPAAVNDFHAGEVSTIERPIQFEDTQAPPEVEDESGRQLETSTRVNVLHQLLEDSCHKSLDDVLLSMRQDGSFLNHINAQDSAGRSPLRLAVEKGLAESTESLIKFGADANEYSPSPLLHAAIRGFESQAPDSNRMKIVRALVNAGVYINAQDSEGWTALHLAVSKGLVEVQQELKELGGRNLELDIMTDRGQSVMDLMVEGDKHNVPNEPKQ